MALKKKLAFSLLVISICTSSLFAQSEKEDYYTKGFNDAFSRGIFDKTYDLEKVNRTIKLHSQRNIFTKKDMDLLDAATDYTEGFINGMYERYTPKENSTKLSTDPISTIDGDLSYSLMSIPSIDTEKEIQKSSADNQAKAVQMNIAP